MCFSAPEHRAHFPTILHCLCPSSRQVISLLQPPPEVVELFDDILLLVGRCWGGWASGGLAGLVQGRDKNGRWRHAAFLPHSPWARLL